MEQVGHGLGPPLFDMFCGDHELVKAMIKEGMKRSCARAAGSRKSQRLSQKPDSRLSLWTSRRRRWNCGGKGACGLRGGQYPGPGCLSRPFDVIIERRTAQLYVRTAFFLAIATVAPGNPVTSRSPGFGGTDGRCGAERRSEDPRVVWRGCSPQLDNTASPVGEKQEMGLPNGTKVNMITEITGQGASYPGQPEQSHSEGSSISAPAAPNLRL